MKKSGRSMFAMLLTVVMVMTFLPFMGSASATVEASTTQTSIKEVVALREENVKHFAMPDGSYQAVVYSEAVHRMDADGNWQEIDNSLSLNSNDGIQTYSIESGRTSFAQTLTSDQPIFTLNDGEYSISMSMTGQQDTVITMGTATEASVTNASPRTAVTFTSLEEATVFDTSSSVLYADAIPGTDLEYILRGNSVKENIIVKAPASSYTYQFSFELDGLYAAQEADGSISLFDSVTEEREFVIPTPYMYDAIDTLSFDIFYELTEEDGIYYLTVVADENWINDESRVWPITIDPTIVTESTIHDTYVSSAYPDSNFGGGTMLWLSHSTSSRGNSETFIRGIMPTLPSGSSVSNAYLTLWYCYNDYMTSGSFNFGVYPVYGYWSESAATWENTREVSVADSWIYVAMADASNGATLSSPKQLTIPLTSLAQYWYEGNSNRGVVLKHVSGNNLSVILKSSESATAYSPHFCVEYEVNRLPDGVYKLTSAGNALTAYASGYATGSTVVQRISENNGTMHEQFKFTYLDTVDGEDYYSIRPMTNSGLGLYAPLAGGNAKVNSISATDSWSSIASTQRWAVSYVDGRYTIRNGSSSSGSYLAVQSASGNDVALIGSSENSVAAKWKLESQTSILNEAVFTQTTNALQLNSTFQFQAIARSFWPGVNGPVSYVVVNEDGTATDKASINASTGVLTAHKRGMVKVGATFEGATDTVWCTVGLYDTGVINVEFIYDGGYAIRYTNPVSRITAQAEALRQKYLEEFGVLIVWGNITQFESLADICPAYGSDPDILCSCEDGDIGCTNHDVIDHEDPPIHHKNLHNILFDIAQPQQANTVKIAYIGHVTCINDEDSLGITVHLEETTAGLSIHGGNVACVAYYNGNAARDTQTLIHEFGHLLGAQDHYGSKYAGSATTDEINDYYGTKDFNEHCIYGGEKESISDYAICKGCKGLISNGLASKISEASE